MKAMKKSYSGPTLSITMFGDGIRTEAQAITVSGLDDGTGDFGNPTLVKAGITRTVQSNAAAAGRIIQFNE